MPLRQLPDGSWLDTMTGNLSGFDPEREAQGRAIAQRQGRWPGNPRPPTPTQQMVVLPSTQGPQAIIDPKQNLLSPNPYELGMGATDPTQDPKKRLLVVAALIAGCGAFVWWKNRKKSEA